MCHFFTSHDGDQTKGDHQLHCTDGIVEFESRCNHSVHFNGGHIILLDYNTIQVAHHRLEVSAMSLVLLPLLEDGKQDEEVVLAKFRIGEGGHTPTIMGLAPF